MSTEEHGHEARSGCEHAGGKKQSEHASPAREISPVQAAEQRAGQTEATEAGWGTLPTGDELAAEVERFLQQGRPDEQ